jgi:hypothetical protein
MTPDESAWWEALIEVLGCGTDTTAQGAACCADEALAELRKRRESGAFGPVAPESTVSQGARLPDGVFEALVRAEGTWHEAGRPQNTAETRFAQEARRARASERSLEQERDNLQSLLNAARVEAERAAARADVAFRERDEQCARAEVAETKMREAEAVAFTHMNMRGNAEAEMRNTAKRADAAERDRDEARALLSKAKAAGYGP